MATVTITLEELDQMRAREKALHDSNAKLISSLAQERATQLSPTQRDLVPLVRAMLPIVQFAVGQLPPETTRGWPAMQLEEVAAYLPRLPDFSDNDLDLCNEFTAFVSKIVDCERERARHKT